MQSTLVPAGPAAESTAFLTGVLAAGAAAILLLVMALLAHGALAGPGRASTGLWVVGGGIVLPVALLSALLVYERVFMHAVHAPSGADALIIEVEGRQWWWEVRYPGAGGAPDVVTANEVHVPVGKEVELLLTAADVIHSFWVPSLAGKVDMVPGRRNRLTLRADRAGAYRGQCAEFCGVQHAQMALLVVAVPPPTFAAWRSHQAEPAPQPADAELAGGLEALLAHGCGGCHTIRGTAAVGRLGPDLTHVGSRRTLAAATLTNHRDAMLSWLTAGDRLKPGNRMPSYAGADHDALAAIAAYLSGLR
jgi:cytochrome c oxidase subunit 2